jgi:hypothetical protein
VVGGSVLTKLNEYWKSVLKKPKEMKWYDYLQSTKPQTPGEDFADSIALLVIMALLLCVVCFL